MAYYDVKNAKITILDILKYDAIQDPDGVMYKDMGNYVQMMVPMKNSKGHDTYEVYFDSSGKISMVKGHNGNSGFSDTKHYNF